jgi:hypothetical protein
MEKQPKRRLLYGKRLKIANKTTTHNGNLNRSLSNHYTNTITMFLHHLPSIFTPQLSEYAPFHRPTFVSKSNTLHLQTNTIMSTNFTSLVLPTPLAVGFCTDIIVVDVVSSRAVLSF